MSVIFEKRGHVAIVTLNRPEKLNAVNKAMASALQEAWHRFRTDRDLRVAVLTGSGERAFSAGIDLKELGEDIGDERWDRKVSWLEGPVPLDADESVRKPVIAAIEGYCVGEGMSFALACDMRVAGEGAVFQLPEVKLGLPTIIAAIRLVRLMPTAPALEMLLTGGLLDAREAYRLGLINHLAPKGGALDMALDLAEKVASNAPLAVQAAREAALVGLTMPFREACRLGEGLRCACLSSSDCLEGMAAFREKRAPQFKGQ